MSEFKEVSWETMKKYNSVQLQNYITDVQREIDFTEDHLRDSRSNAFQLLEALEAEVVWYLVRANRYSDLTQLYGPFDLERAQGHMARFGSDDGVDAEGVQDFDAYQADTPDHFLSIVKLDTLHPDFTVEFMT